MPGRGRARDRAAGHADTRHTGLARHRHARGLNPGHGDRPRRIRSDRHGDVPTLRAGRPGVREHAPRHLPRRRSGRRDRDLARGHHRSRGHLPMGGEVQRRREQHAGDRLLRRSNGTHDRRCARRTAPSGTAPSGHGPSGHGSSGHGSSGHGSSGHRALRYRAHRLACCLPPGSRAPSRSGSARSTSPWP